jgi:putative toxin-antitoxin system antitoxin component (TIGR02293 family)
MARKTTEYLIDVLGGRATFTRETAPTSADVHRGIKRGLPYRSFESLRARLGLSVAEAAGVLHMPPRTLARRRQTRKLDAEESDRLYRIARIAAHAVAVFGKEEPAINWLRRPNRALGGEVPLHLLDTDLGARLVEDVLGRIEHGVVG